MLTVKCQTWSDESNLTQQDLDPFKDRRMRGGGTFLTRGREGGSLIYGIGGFIARFIILITSH